MGCRKIFYTPHDLPVGRDIFEKIGFSNGFKLKRKRNTMKTTWSQRVEVHPNLVEGITINNINKVFQSDIFYLKVEKKDYYGICILDVYSRKLLALHVSQSLFAIENVKALKKVIKLKTKQGLNNCIFHSDRGSQYISKAHKELLLANDMKISMCKIPQENAYVERMNGIIKEEYFYEMHLTQTNILEKTKEAMNLYNNHRPHSQLKMMTPTAFEHYVSKLDEIDRPKQTIFKWVKDLSTKQPVVNKEKRSKKEI
jgi:transposase InsO family protein